MSWWEDAIDFVTDYVPYGDTIDNVLGINGNDTQSNVLPMPVNHLVPSNGVPTQTAPSPGTSMTKNFAGCAITMPLGRRTVAYAPPGYVAVDTDNDGITDTAMLKPVARACGLWKPRPKPLLTASERKTLNKATSVMRKVDSVVKQTNELRGQAKLTKSRPHK